MNLIYISNTRIPSEKANSYQSIIMASVFTNYFSKVELWVGDVRNTKDMRKVKDIFDFYGIENNFPIKKIKQFDCKYIAYINEFLWSQIRNTFFAFNVCFRLMKFRKKPNYVFYTRTFHFALLFYFLRKIKIFKNLIIYEVHNHSYLNSYIASKVDAIIVINNYLKNVFVKKNNNIHVAHDGVELNSFSKIGNVNLSKKSYNVLYSGSFYEWKGVKTLIDSSKFLPNCFKIKCVGGSGAALENIIKYCHNKGLDNRIEILPFQNRKKLLRIIENSDILVLPNSSKRNESLYTSPLKLFEYMASKRPIVASNIDSIKEILNEDNAYLFAADDPKDLALKIIQATKEGFQNKVENAYSDVQSYTWNKRAEGIFKFISRLKV